MKPPAVLKKGEIVVSSALILTIAVFAVLVIGGAVFLVLRSSGTEVKRNISSDELAYFDPTGQACDTVLFGEHIKTFNLLEAVGRNTGGTNRWGGLRYFRPTAPPGVQNSTHPRFGTDELRGSAVLTEEDTNLDLNGNGRNDGNLEFSRMLVMAEGVNMAGRELDNNVIAAVGIPQADFTNSITDWADNGQGQIRAFYNGISIHRGLDNDGQACWETSLQWARFSG